MVHTVHSKIPLVVECYSRVTQKVLVKVLVQSVTWNEGYSPLFFLRLLDDGR